VTFPIVGWKEFFDRHRDFHVTMSFYGQERTFSLEDLYQAFKARADAERAENLSADE
jgi:hypothetical protein